MTPPFDTTKWIIRDGFRQHPPIEWQNVEGLVLILAWVEDGKPQTLWARRRDEP